MYPRPSDEKHLVPLLDFIRYVSYQGRRESRRLPKRINGSKGLAGLSAHSFEDDLVSAPSSYFPSPSRQLSPPAESSRSEEDRGHMQLNFTEMNDDDDVSEDSSHEVPVDSAQRPVADIADTVADGEDETYNVKEEIESLKCQHEEGKPDKELANSTFSTTVMEAGRMRRDQGYRVHDAERSEDEEQSLLSEPSGLAASPSPTQPNEDDASTSPETRLSSKRCATKREYFPPAEREGFQSRRTEARTAASIPMLTYEYIQPGSASKGTFNANYVDIPLSEFGAERLIPTWDTKVAKKAGGSSCCYLALGTSAVITGVVLEVAASGRNVQVAPDRGLNVAVEWIDYDRLYRLPEDITRLRSQVSTRMKAIIASLKR